MRKNLIKLVNKVSDKIIDTAGKEWGCDFIRRFANRNRISLLRLAYNDIGILNYKDYHESGELYLLRNVLREKMGMGAKSIVFDVGANVGNYTKMLREVLAGAEIYAFEPNKFAFSKLESMCGKAVRCFNTGFGDVVGTGKIYTYENRMESSHSSSYPMVFKDFHRSEGLKEMDFVITTVDDFCREHGVHKVDFLKIDTEGNELNVIAGAKQMIATGQICAIQFEFGECNVFSRVFLRDFYEHLQEYNLYRLNSRSLIPISQYNVENEIFRYQNIFALKKGLDPLPLG